MYREHKNDPVITNHTFRNAGKKTIPVEIIHSIHIELSGYHLYREFQTLYTVPMYEEMIVTGAWWDLVDELATHRVGGLLATFPDSMRSLMLEWAHDKDLWKRRTAILCQNRFKSRTDTALLYACIEPSLSDNDFFARKAIAWALREYAKTNPGEVIL